MPGRLLILGVRDDGGILGWAGAPDGAANKEFLELAEHQRFDRIGVFHQIPLPGLGAQSDREALLFELERVCRKGWIDSKRLDAKGRILPCDSQNCGGLTLEAELGVTPNGYSEPDFRGWEVKQHTVSRYGSLSGGPITLMTPEPTGGVYAKEGVIPFIRQFGYPDGRGRADRRNFGGVHRANEVCKKTGLTLTLMGYDIDSHRITDAKGGIALIDKKGQEAAVWAFSGLMKHWNRKHASAAYIPSLMRQDPGRQYRFGPSVRLGVGTDFLKFLAAVGTGSVYYDPGIKAESWSSTPVVKRRSQFRIKSKEVVVLYDTTTSIHLT